jgi:hypothetical protein
MYRKNVKAANSHAMSAVSAENVSLSGTVAYLQTALGESTENREQLTQLLVQTKGENAALHAKHTSLSGTVASLQTALGENVENCGQLVQLLIQTKAENAALRTENELLRATLRDIGFSL